MLNTHIDNSSRTTKLLPKQTVVESGADYHEAEKHFIDRILDSGTTSALALDVRWVVVHDRLTDLAKIHGRFTVNGKTYTESYEFCPRSLKYSDKLRRDEILQKLMDKVTKTVTHIALHPLSDVILKELDGQPLP